MSTVLLLESVPSKTERREAEVAEVSPTGDDISGTVEFEEKRFARLECAELAIARWLPEINLVRLLGFEIGEPVVICYPDEKTHGKIIRPASRFRVQSLFGGDAFLGRLTMS